MNVQARLASITDRRAFETFYAKRFAAFVTTQQRFGFGMIGAVDGSGGHLFSSGEHIFGLVFYHENEKRKT